MKECAKAGKIPVSAGVDTWGVDFVLLDENDRVLGDTIAYRDSRTNGMDEEVYRLIPEKELYARTGIQKAIFNTVYQLMAVKKQQPQYLKQAKSLLMIPDYFHFLLTGNKVQEYTNATTGQLVNPKTNDWDYELMEILGYPKEIFQEIKMPGTFGWRLTEGSAKEVGFQCKLCFRQRMIPVLQ